jgi:bloom syndrome protein
LSLHGAGKHLAKGEAARILRHLVIEEILIEDVKKSENYGSVSSVLKTNHKKSGDLLSGKHNVVLKFVFFLKHITENCLSFSHFARHILLKIILF